MRFAVPVVLAVGLALGAEPQRPARAAQPVATEADPWQIPEEGACAPRGGLRGRPFGQDAPPVPFQSGDAFGIDRIEVLRSYLPPAMWEYRERFFYEGMRLEVGPCFRDYSPPAFFQEATRAFRGQARLLENGGLADYSAGLPFSPDTIRADHPEAGLKWAWNVEHRYQGGGFRGRFRVTDLVGRIGRAEPFEGELFKLQLSYRADRSASGYEQPGSRNSHWVAGGLFFEPFSAREYAWRQFRNVAHQQDPDRSDDLHAYLPQWRRVRRMNANNVEGIFMPSFSVGVVQDQQLLVGTGDAAGAGGVAAAGAGGSVGGSITPKRSGFEGLEIRPLLYSMEILGVQDVLAPINAAAAAYPTEEDREFGPWGLSFASDRWDLRRALVLGGTAKATTGGAQVSRFEMYVDLQTLQPLYYLSFDSRGERIDVGYYVGRWSEDRSDYPPWPEAPERPVRVLDPVGAAFANLSERGSWRRESWEMVSTPPEDRTVKRMISVGQLSKRR
jgi:hypothetical protein